MTHTMAPGSTTDYDTYSPWGHGLSMFAAVMMIMAGIFHFLQGLVAVINGDEFLVSTPNYVFALDVNGWGWAHLILGVIVAAAGAFVLTGNPVARGVGIVVAGLSAVANFLWLPYYPIWSLIVIAFDVFVIWALATTNLGRVANMR